MTALDRARSWFIAPPDASSGEPSWCAPPAAASTPPADTVAGMAVDLRVAQPSGHTPPEGAARGGWQPPVADDGNVEPAAVPARVVTPAAGAVVGRAGAAGKATEAASPPVVTSAAVVGRAGAADKAASPPVVTSAAVLGRAGEVEPVAAALALALRRESRAATATVAVIGAAVPDVAGGGGAARRLGARLEGQGFEVRVRGRLAWVRLDPADGQLAAAARRLTLVGAPAVLAVAAPRNAATDAALVECDLLVIVATEPEGPLARLAAASGLAGVRAVTVRPLGRAARALARGGISSTRPLRHLLWTEQEQQR